MDISGNRMTDRATPVAETACRIVRATLGDLPALVPLFDAYRVFYRQPSDPARASAFLGERLVCGESVIFLARDGAGAALGFTQLYPCFSSVSASRFWILNDLYVEARARRLGVARALVKAANAHAITTGAARVTLTTARENAPAQALYESLGYVRETKMLDYTLEFPWA